MPDAITIDQPTDTADYDPQPQDAAELRAEIRARQLASLAEMREVCVTVGRELALQSAQPGAACDATLGVMRVSKSLRQIIALEDKLAEAYAEGIDLILKTRRDRKKNVVRRAVRDAMRDDDPEIERSELNYDVWDLFKDYDDYEDFDFENGSLRDIVIQICETLGIEPDLSLWPEDEPEPVQPWAAPPPPTPPALGRGIRNETPPPLAGGGREEGGRNARGRAPP